MIGTRTLTAPAGTFHTMHNGTITAAGLEGSLRTINWVSEDGATATVAGASFTSATPVSCTLTVGTLPLSLHGEGIILRSRPAGLTGKVFAAFHKYGHLSIGENGGGGFGLTASPLVLFDNAGFYLGKDMAFRWSNGTNSSGANDTGFRRQAAGVMQVDTGSSGTPAQR